MLARKAWCLLIQVLTRQGHNQREEILSYLKFWVDVCDFFLYRAHTITQLFPLLSSSRTTNHVQASRISSVTLLCNVIYAIEHCCSSFEMFPLLDQLLNLTSHFQNIWPWSSQGKGLGNEVTLVWGRLLCLQWFTVESSFPDFGTP